MAVAPTGTDQPTMPVMSSTLGAYSGPQGVQGPPGPGTPSVDGGFGAANAAFNFGKQQAANEGSIAPSAAQLEQAYAAYHPQQPNPVTPGVQSYLAQFQQSQNAQQQAMNAGLLQALHGLGARRDAAAAVAAQLPGQFDQQYKQAQSAQSAAANTVGAQQLGKGVPAANAAVQGAARADSGAIAASNADQRAAGKADQPLLNAAIQADYSKGATTLDNTNMQNQAALDAQAQQFAMQQSAQQAGFQHDIQMAKLTSDLGTKAFVTEHPGGVQTPAQALQQQEDYFKFTTDNSIAPGPAGSAGFTTAQANQIQQSPDYQAAQNIIAENGSRKPGDKGYIGPDQKGQTWSAWLTQEYGNYQGGTLARYLLATLPQAFLAAAPAGT